MPENSFIRTSLSYIIQKINWLYGSSKIGQELLANLAGFMDKTQGKVRGFMGVKVR